jgi:N-acetyl-anhydromuramyl-L-alanine amidase AmpD
MNKHIILKSKQDNKPLIELSVKSNGYDNNNDYLNCIAHPLQISVDPSVCLIRNPLWMGKDGFIDVVQDQAAATTAPDRKVAKDAASLIFEGYKGFGTKETKLVEGVSKITTLLQLTYFNEYISLYGDYNDLQEVLNGELEFDNIDVLLKIKAQLETINGVIVDYKSPRKQLNSFEAATLKEEGKYGKVTKEEFDDFLLTKGQYIILNGVIYRIRYALEKNTIRITVPATQTAPGTPYTILKEASSAIANIEFLNKLTYDYFYNNKPENEIATQAHIYVNVDYLFRKSIDANIELQDKNGKNEINLYAYVKKVMYDIQTSIGNINNFEVHVDPQDNVARIIDINYTEPDKAAYNNLFPLEIHNLSSTVRSYSLESKIFPEQSAMIAIGAQVKGGQIGIQSNTMIDFNRNLTDRIIKEKIFPGNSDLTVTNNIPSVTNGLAKIIEAFAALDKFPVASGTTTDINSLFANAKNSLRDIIIYFQSLVPSPGSNRGIIPTKFSFEMDGIGGLVIGNMFRLPKDILPKGYRGELNGIGSQLAQAITGIGHTISNGEWKTKVDTLNIVLDNNKSKFNKLDISELKKQVAAAVASYNLSAAAQGPSRDLNTINQIILHDTDGFFGISGTLAVLNGKNESIHYIIDRNGKIARPVGIEKAAQHAGPANRLSVGIEICNSNGMIQLSNGILKGAGNHVYPNSGKEGEKVLLGLVTQEGQNVTGGIRDLGWFLNQRRFYEGYSVAQMDALKTVILEILQKCPNIKLNYTADELNIYQNVFGLKSLTALPTKNQQINTTRDWNASNSGIFAHAVVSNQRGDAHVDPEMTKILKAIKTETNR